ncbi:uncharacterized protein CcaverHIS019_0405860 [Cutaneotrichosporon cavernicola]|uniref:Transmembrane protein n=1 Tax=Cutaneotrichosporon cavernicola TaxID=279322 RepID=A0AA48L4E9_9TREE|nr:uncharacterized protein CcaverHIS019_0405860 [Cutaneotrichosporon cavernicola]BEI91766.1 hypothetical protein CcaverHIS019_0405860 [Cutaneotrichosporon cavernicola]BEI99538.1 hypothetical protein CcaverHIS631_0405810 [Cutaneotrichosporon cavernicola]BEJ07315.1 hypothetical protein CcaverHIS641_0405840 [Cutaneotrichosporon cavernicola]
MRYTLALLFATATLAAAIPLPNPHVTTPPTISVSRPSTRPIIAYPAVSNSSGTRFLVKRYEVQFSVVAGPLIAFGILFFIFLLLRFLSNVTQCGIRHTREAERREQRLQRVHPHSGALPMVTSPSVTAVTRTEDGDPELPAYSRQVEPGAQAIDVSLVERDIADVAPPKYTSTALP